MNNMNPLNAYKETQIKTANQGKLIVMLYDGAIKNINLAINSLDNSDQKYDEINNNIIKTQDIVTELTVSLDFDKGESIAKNLFSIYIYVNKLLLDANIKKDTKPLAEAKDLLSQLREAWIEVANKVNFNSNPSNSSGINIAG